MPATKEPKPRRGRKPKQPNLIDVAPEEHKTLIALAEKHAELASERGRLGKELQETDEALLAEMKHLRLKTWSRDGLTVSITETEEKVKVKCDAKGGEENEDSESESDEVK